MFQVTEELKGWKGENSLKVKITKQALRTPLVKSTLLFMFHELLGINPMKGLDGPEENLEKEKDLEQELNRRALLTDWYKVTHET